MSIASKLSGLISAKASLKNSIEDFFGASIPSTDTIDTYASYMLPPGYYKIKPSANGVYIMYSDGTYTDYDTVWSGKTGAAVALLTSQVSLLIHSEKCGTASVSWGTSTTQLSGLMTTTNTSTALTDFAGRNNTNVIISSGYAGTAMTWAVSKSFPNNTYGYIPAVGEMNAIIQNEGYINTAFSNIGVSGLPTDHIWCSTQSNYKYGWLKAASLQDFYNFGTKTDKFAAIAVTEWT